jgi:hypothetical protein
MKRLVLGLAITGSSLGFVAYAQKAAAPGTPPPAAAPAAGGNMVNCGKMMAEKAQFPAKMSELHTQIADNLEAHIKMLSSCKDKACKDEVAALKKMVKPLRDAAAMDKKMSGEMEKMASLAAAPHDMSKMDPKAADGMMKQMALEKELGTMFTKDAAQMEQMMKQMHAPGGAPGK